MGKTKRQWLLEGRIPVDENAGTREWTNGFHQQTAIYWEEGDTRKATPEEIAAFKEEERAKRRRQAAKRKQKEAYLRKKCEESRHWKTAYQWLQNGMVPDKTAKWVLGENLNERDFHFFGSEYYYCHRDNVVENPDLANELLLQYPAGSYYDGSPWW